MPATARANVGMTWLLCSDRLGMPKCDWVGRVGHGRHGGEAPAMCVGSDDVGLDFLVLFGQAKRTMIDKAAAW